jgi:hypothetical protein
VQFRSLPQQRRGASRAVVSCSVGEGFAPFGGDAGTIGVVALAASLVEGVACAADQ